MAREKEACSTTVRQPPLLVDSVGRIQIEPQVEEKGPKWAWKRSGPTAGLFVFVCLPPDDWLLPDVRRAEDLQ